jgi:hypothetical protein
MLNDTVVELMEALDGVSEARNCRSFSTTQLHTRETRALVWCNQRREGVISCDCVPIPGPYYILEHVMELLLKKRPLGTGRIGA